MDLKPCPFCGSTTATVLGYIRKFVRCFDCGADLPCGALSREEAIEKWNTRHND